MDKLILDTIALWKENISSEELNELNSYTEDRLFDSFYKDLEFGTAGLRGKLGLGPNRMNKYIVAKVSLGFARYVKKKYGDSSSIVVSYDNRCGSTLFSKVASCVFASVGIKVYLFSNLRPTPELSYAVRKLNCDGGLMITASHNPNDYNGYKVYDNTGCQLTPDLIEDVIKEINDIDDLFSIKYDDIDKYNNIVLLDSSFDQYYLDEVKKISINKLTSDDKSKLKVVFTPLHGTGSTITSQFLISEGYNVTPVDEQMVNDPMFTTVPYPNPEESKAFTLAIEKGKEIGADILIATDPDADRMGIAIKHKDDNDYTLLTGNQTGAIILDYLGKYKEHNNLAQVYSTIVTSEVATLICDKYGLNLNRTLTGFKYIGEQARLIENTNKSFFFGYEESYGYVLKDFVRDKDSVQACFILLEIATFYYTKYNKTLLDVLNDLYNTYGYFLDLTTSISFDGSLGLQKMKDIMTNLRNNKLFKLSTKDVKYIEDYQLSKRYYKDGLEEDLTLPKSDVIKYVFDNNGWVTVRPSGTEPKVKVYYSLYGDNTYVNNLLNELKEFMQSIMK